MPEPFVIEELTGSQRSVELRDRLLPFKGAAWPGEQRSEKKKYPGNPVATIQVLGPDEIDTEIRGRWKDRHINANMVSLRGWDSIVSTGEQPTVEQLVQIFHNLRRSGNQIEVRWGPEVRRGILKRFDPNWHRLDLVEWQMRFEWSQYGTALPSPFTSVQQTATMSAEVAAALAAVNDLRSGMPSVMYPDIIAQCLTLGATIGAATLELTTSVAEVQGVPAVTQEEFQGIASKASDVITACEAMRQLVGDYALVELLPTDDVNDGFEVIAWARDMSAVLVALAVKAVEARENIRERTVSDYLADVRIRAGQTLRDIAREYYDAPDDWVVIEEANNLVGSVHPDGTRVLVPRREAGGGRAT